MRDVKYRGRILFHLITGNDKFEASSGNNLSTCCVDYADSIKVIHKFALNEA